MIGFIETIVGISSFFVRTTRLWRSMHVRMLSTRFWLTSLRSMTLLIPIFLRKTWRRSTLSNQYEVRAINTGEKLYLDWIEVDTRVSNSLFVKMELDLYNDHPEKFRALQHTDMIQDFSWDVPAGKYMELFEKMLSW